LQTAVVSTGSSREASDEMDRGKAAREVAAVIDEEVESSA
jgi:hypothetical protein